MGEKACKLKGRSSKRPRCPDCWSSQTLFRIKTKSFVCRVCGRIFIIDEKREYHKKREVSRGEE